MLAWRLITFHGVRYWYKGWGSLVRNKLYQADNSIRKAAPVFAGLYKEGEIKGSLYRHPHDSHHKPGKQDDGDVEGDACATDHADVTLVGGFQQGRFEDAGPNAPAGMKKTFLKQMELNVADVEITANDDDPEGQEDEPHGGRVDKEHGITDLE